MIEKLLDADDIEFMRDSKDSIIALMMDAMGEECSEQEIIYWIVALTDCCFAMIDIMGESEEVLEYHLGSYEAIIQKASTKLREKFKGCDESKHTPIHGALL
jgi:hypothetical protein